MKQVWKYELEPTSYIEMPAGARVLSVGAQRNNICLWVLVDPDKPKEIRIFESFGTGHNIDPGLHLEFIGTVLVHHDTLVFHVFEVLK